MLSSTTGIWMLSVEHLRILVLLRLYSGLFASASQAISSAGREPSGPDLPFDGFGGGILSLENNSRSISWLRCSTFLWEPLLFSLQLLFRVLESRCHHLMLWVLVWVADENRCVVIKDLVTASFVNLSLPHKFSFNEYVDSFYTNI